MNINVRLSPGLAELVGRPRLTVAVAEEATVADLLAALQSDQPALTPRLGAAVAMILFNRLVQRTDALFAATVTYLMPVVSIFWGVLDGEQLGWWVFLGMFLILAGVFITNRLSLPQKQKQ